MIETVGYATAVSAADAAVKAADVEVIGIEKVIGVAGKLGVTIHFSGDVASVKSAVEAGKKEAERVGEVISAHVIPRAHRGVENVILSRFKLESTKEKTTEKNGKNKNDKGKATKKANSKKTKKEIDETTNQDKTDDHSEEEK